MLHIIAAIGNQGEIGFNNQLLCHLPEDLKRFKKMTSEHTVVMGRKTWDSLPARPLPNRRNIVLTHQNNLHLIGAEIFNDKKEVLDLLTTEEIFVIGGGETYRLFWREAEMLHITRILADFEADTYFPSIIEQEWQLIKSSSFAADEANPYNLLFQTFTKSKIC